MPVTNRNRTLPLYHWALRETDPENSIRCAKQFAPKIGCTPLTARVLLARGIDAPDSARDYLNPTRSQILPPDAIPGIDMAVARLKKAVESQEPVFVHGDYDADGIIGTVILHQTLKDSGIPSRIFLPRRDVHGFGLSVDAVNKAHEAGIKLIVSVDCGISSADTVAVARQKGIEVIVTDHHALPERLPADAILVHPDLDDTCQGSGIAGAAVAFKLALALLKAVGRDPEEAFNHWLPLVAVATVADVCCLTGENRAITALGLTGIASTTIPGLRTLHLGSRREGSNGPATARDIAFGMAPLLNAAGRMGDPLHAAKLLLAKDDDAAWLKFRRLFGLNNERKRIQNEICRRLLLRPEIAWAGEHAGILAVVDKDCTPGLAGLAASRLAEETGRPTCVLSPIEDESGFLYRGSMRTTGSENLIELMDPLKEYTEALGGHNGAIGLTVRPEYLDRFMESCSQIKWTPVLKTLTLDFRIENPPSKVDEVLDLDKTQPWGEGNPQPAFMWDGVTIEQTRAVGKELEHLQVYLQSANGTITKGIGFSMANLLKPEEIAGIELRAAGHFTVNTWQGNSSVEFQVKDFNLG